MANFVERRKYKRCSSTICKASMSTDEKIWKEIELHDISAGGLNFTSKNAYEMGQKFYFIIILYNAFSEFTMRFEGEIVHHHKMGETYSYGIKFVNVNKYYQIQLDELIKAKNSIADEISQHHHAFEEGTYAFMQVPKVKRPKNKIVL